MALTPVDIALATVLDGAAALPAETLPIGQCAFRILAEDLSQGLMLLEDLGDDLYARLLTTDPGREAELYAPAVDVLLHLQAAVPPPDLPNLTADDWAGATFVATGRDKYALVLDIGGGRQATKADGSPYTFSLKQLLAGYGK